MTISINRNQEACCTCIFWGGDRHLTTEKFDKVQVQEKQTGVCNGPGITERNETKALGTCQHWREM